MNKRLSPPIILRLGMVIPVLLALLLIILGLMLDAARRHASASYASVRPHRRKYTMANPQLVNGGPAITVPLNDGAVTSLVNANNFSIITKDPNQTNGAASVVPGFSNISLLDLPVTVNGLTVLSAVVQANEQYTSVTIQASAGCTLPSQLNLFFATQGSNGIPNSGPFDTGSTTPRNLRASFID